MYAAYSLTPVHTMLHTMATLAGLVVWDLYDAFRAYDPQELKVVSNTRWYDPWHPNSKGHTIIAEYIVAGAKCRRATTPLMESQRVKTSMIVSWTSHS
jgi:hypothetical protein